MILMKSRARLDLLPRRAAHGVDPVADAPQRPQRSSKVAAVVGPAAEIRVAARLPQRLAAITRRGPSISPSSTARTRPWSAPPTSRTVVKPRRSIPFMVRAARSAVSEDGRAAFAPMSTREAITCTCASMRPGISTRPARSMRVAAALRMRPSETSLMRSPSTSTSAPSATSPRSGSSIAAAGEKKRRHPDRTPRSGAILHGLRRRNPSAAAHVPACAGRRRRASRHPTPPPARTGCTSVAPAAERGEGAPNRPARAVFSPRRSDGGSGPGRRLADVRTRRGETR